MFITKKHISRRAVLKGMGVTMALPLLDAMVPAGTAFAKTAAGKIRLVCIEMVHGAAGCTDFGRTKNLWSPAAAGRAFDLTPTSMISLEPYRDYLTIISDTDVHFGEAITPAEVGADHVRSTAVTFTQAYLKHTREADVRAGISLDQVYAQRFGQDTPVPSLQLCIDGAGAGCSSYGYSCVYQDTISWATPTEPLPIGGSQPSLQPRHRCRDRVQNALVFLPPDGPLRSRRPEPE